MPRGKQIEIAKEPAAPRAMHTVTLELPAGEGPLDIFNAFTAIAQNLIGLASGEPKPALNEFQQGLLDGAIVNAKSWAKKLERYG